MQRLALELGNDTCTEIAQPATAISMTSRTLGSRNMGRGDAYSELSSCRKPANNLRVSMGETFFYMFDILAFTKINTFNCSSSIV